MIYQCQNTIISSEVTLTDVLNNCSKSPEVDFMPIHHIQVGLGDTAKKMGKLDVEIEYVAQIYMQDLFC